MRKPDYCENCGKPLIEVEDEIAKKKTGHIFKYSCSCMDKNIRVSVG